MADSQAERPRRAERIDRAAWCGNSVYHDEYPPGQFDARCGACQRSRIAIQALLDDLAVPDVALQAQIAKLTDQRDAYWKAERETSAAYLRVRTLVDAWDTAPGGTDRFEVTERHITELKARAEQAEQHVKELGAQVVDLASWKESALLAFQGCSTLHTVLEGRHYLGWEIHAAIVDALKKAEAKVDRLTDILNAQEIMVDGRPLMEGQLKDGVVHLQRKDAKKDT